LETLATYWKIAGIHSQEEKRNKLHIFNALRQDSLQFQRIFQKNDNFSTTHRLEKENSLQPKHVKKAARKVQVSTNRNRRFDPFACFVTIFAAISPM
jgi:dsDNA-binding SOS-regulon protein